MILIEFSGLSFYDSDFASITYNEGFCKVTEDFKNTITGEWDGNIYDIQHIVYNAYNIELYLRESKYKEFQKIQYASAINIYEKNNSYNAKIIKFEAEKFVNEFIKVNITFADISSKMVENVILLTKKEEFVLYGKTGVVFSTNLNLDIIEDTVFTQNIADEFKDVITDYSKISTIKKCRLYLETSDLNNFYTSLKNVYFANVYYSYIFLENKKYTQYKIKRNIIGNDLHQIDITLFSENTIN